MRPRGSRAAARPSTWAGAWMLTPARAPTMRQAASSWLACAAEAATRAEAASASPSVNSRAFRRTGQAAARLGQRGAGGRRPLPGALDLRRLGLRHLALAVPQTPAPPATSSPFHSASSPGRASVGSTIRPPAAGAVSQAPRETGVNASAGSAQPGPPGQQHLARQRPHPAPASPAPRSAPPPPRPSSTPRARIDLDGPLGRRLPGNPAQQHLDPLVQHRPGPLGGVRRPAAAPAGRRASRTPAGCRWWPPRPACAATGPRPRPAPAAARPAVTRARCRRGPTGSPRWRAMLNRCDLAPQHHPGLLPVEHERAVAAQLSGVAPEEPLRGRRFAGRRAACRSRGSGSVPVRARRGVALDHAASAVISDR